MNKEKKVKTKIITESLIIFFIALTPFLIRLPDYLPLDDNNNVSILGFTIGKNGFSSAHIYIWFLINKIIPLYICLFWFFTSKDWWYHIILIPLAMYAFQIFESVFYNSPKIDTENILWLLPVCMVIIPMVYFIRVKIYDKYVNGIDLDAMDAELKDLKEKEQIRNKENNMKKVS